MIFFSLLLSAPLGVPDPGGRADGLAQERDDALPDAGRGGDLVRPAAGGVPQRAGHHVRHPVLEGRGAGGEADEEHHGEEDGLRQPGGQHRVQVQREGQHQEGVRALEHAGVVPHRPQHHPRPAARPRHGHLRLLHRGLVGGRPAAHQGGRVRALLHHDGGGRPRPMAEEERRADHLRGARQPGEGREIRHRRRSEVGI